MSENIKNKATENKENTQTVVETSINTDNPLTAREIFEKIAELQKQLTESSYHSLHRLDDSISSICSDENEEKSEQVSEVCSVFKMRETTLIKMLELYEKMYDDLSPQQKTNKVNKTKCENVVNDKMIAHSKENGKAVVSISNDAHYYIWEIVSGWPDIISNEENLKIIADLNMTNTEIMEKTTSALYQIFHTINTDREVIIRVANTDKE